MVTLQFLVVMVAIFAGSRLGGIGLGLMGGVGLAVLTFGFHLAPTSPPVDVLLMILSVVTASAVLQAAGGLDLLVNVAERMLRRRPHLITYLGPLTAFAFTVFAGTGHLAYPLLPIIAEVAREAGIRPERPLAVSVIASQQAITASPISAATVALLGLTATRHVELLQILLVSLPAGLLGIVAAAFVMNHVGLELQQDPIYLQRLKARRCLEPGARLPKGTHLKGSAAIESRDAKRAVGIFFLAIVLVVLFGSLSGLRPVWEQQGGLESLSMATIIEVLMLSAAALIVVVSKVDMERIADSTVFKAGMQAVIAIFGIAWLGDTFFAGNKEILGGPLKNMVTMAPWSFALALFLLSVLLFSQAATVRALMPLGLSLGIPVPSLVAMFPAVNGYFFLPNYPTLVAAVQFDSTGTTRIGRYVLNHSFMLPGLVALTISIACSFLLTTLLF